MRIIVFWDSIGEWFYDSKKWGWVNRLKLFYFKKWDFAVEVTNASIAWYTSQDILTHFENILKAFTARQEGKEKETYIIFAIGINDSCFFDNIWKSQNIPLDIFEENIIKLIEKASKIPWVKKTILVNSILVDESKLTPASWGEYYYKNETIRKYNEVLKNISKSYNLNIIDIENEIEKSDLPDWIHPNARWHKKIYKKIVPILEELLNKSPLWTI